MYLLCTKVIEYARKVFKDYPKISITLGVILVLMFTYSMFRGRNSNPNQAGSTKVERELHKAGENQQAITDKLGEARKDSESVTSGLKELDRKVGEINTTNKTDRGLIQESNRLVEENRGILERAIKRGQKENP